MVFDIPMMIRERSLVDEDFKRMYFAIQLIQNEAKSKKLIQLKELFEPEIFRMKILDVLH